MSRITFNYLALIGALFAPLWAFGFAQWPRLIVSSASLLSIVLLASVLTNLVRRRPTTAPPTFHAHATIQWLVLLVLTVGGVAAAYRTLSYYDRSRLGVGFEVSLQAVVLLVWVLCLGALIYGGSRLVIDHIEARRQAAAQAAAAAVAAAEAAEVRQEG